MGLIDSWLDLRDRCLTSDRFQRFAAQFPLTRPIVRKRQSELFDVVSGFVYSQILLTCIELDVFAHIGRGISLEALAAQIGLGEDETRRLCEGAASLRLLQKRKGLFRLGDLGAALVANPGAIAMVRHHPHLYRDLADPIAFLKNGRGETNLSRFWAYARSADPAGSDGDQVRIYSELMATSQDMVSAEVLAAFDFRPFKNLLDVGGGHGAFISAVAKRNSHLNVQLFDLPAVADQAKAALKAAGLTGRSQVHSGSFFDDALPKGADLISLVRIIHDHDDAPCMAILKAVFDALEEGGTLIVCEPMSTGGHAARISEAYFNFYLYAMGSGTPRSLDQLQHMLQITGFTELNHVTTRYPFITSIVSAKKPSPKV
ncbi:MAG: methyltransferase [Pseudomonadota bacterium]